MKKIRIVTLVMIVILSMALVPAAAAGAPPGTWVSGISCQNLSATDIATITLSFYPTDNSVAALNYNDTIAAGGSRNYFTPSTPPGLPTSFLGSAVVSSDQPVTCNINTQSTGSGTNTNPYRFSTSAGFSSNDTAPTMYAPQVMKNLAGAWSSYIAVQNSENAAVAVTVSYKDSAGNPVSAATEGVTIPANSNHVFYQTDNTNLPTGFIGAATISANDGTSKLAVMVNFYNNASSSSTAQFHSYSGFNSGANKLYVPRVVRNFYGYNSGLSIQNVGGSSTTVSIDFTIGGNTYSYTSPSINPGAALSLYLPNVTQLALVDSLPMGTRYGGAVITAAVGGAVVAIVNEDNRGGAGIPVERAGQGSTYNAIADGTQTSTISFAQIARKAGGVFSGGFQITNTTNTVGTCDITYSGVASANETGVTLPASGSISRYAPNVANLPNGFNASVSATCTQPVVGISNMAVEPGTGKYGDTFLQGNGLNR